MATNYEQAGNIIPWTNGTGSAVVSGQVVKIGQTLGVALVDIASTASGAVSLEGVYSVPKVSGAVIAQGEMMIWDDSAAAFDDNAATPAAGDVSGVAMAWEAAGDGVTTIEALFDARIGTVTAGT